MISGPLPAPAADDRLGKEDRQDQDETGEHVQDDERGAAMFSHHVREPPDIAQADGAAGHRHDHGKTTAEVFARSH